MAATDSRTANYKPSIWNHEYIESLNSVYGEERFLQRAEKLKGEVRALLEKTEDPVDQLELVDVLQRLGIFYHFTRYVDRILENIYVHNYVDDDEPNTDDSLHVTALRFRLLRQHGYNISPQVFRNFMDQSGDFKTSLCDDVKGLLSLFEASYLAMEGESILEAARVFACHNLNRKLKQNINKNLVEEMGHAMELPFHWRMERLESRWFVDVYERRQDANPLLLELAKLDFNILQKLYQDELKELSSWHTKTRLAEKLRFGRDRLVECFLWAVGITFEPKYRCSRAILTKLGLLITLVDDFYDAYGNLDELQLFTSAVDRWDINDLEGLPQYVKICFLAVFNTINEMAYDVLRDQGFNIVPHCKKMWGDLCKLYMMEAEWYYSGYKPSLDEYLASAWISVAGPMLLVTTYFSMTNPLNDKDVEATVRYHEVVKWTSLILRLADDLGTSTDELERGDNPKSIQCHMHDTGCCEEDSRGYIRNLIESTWKRVNKDVLMNEEYSRDFIRTSINLARTSQCIYQYGDGHGDPDCSRARILRFVVEPIPLP